MGIEPLKLARTALATAALLAAAACRVDGTPARGQQPAQATAARDATAAAACEVVEKGITLTDGLEESSGVVQSRTHRGVYWTHNDSGHGSDIYPISVDGRQLGKVKVEGATNHDWEDIAIGRCPAGTGDCLYLADTGDNGGGGRHLLRLAVLPEPEPDARTARAQEYEALMPGRRPDIEALAVLPDGSIYLVSKGINGPVELIRWPTPLRADMPATVELVRQLAPEAAELGDRVTGASASPNGKWVAVRTYAALAFYRTDDLLGSAGPFAQMDLEPLGEPQGEAVSLADDGNVVLTSEGSGHHLPGTISRLRCVLPQ